MKANCTNCGGEGVEAYHEEGPAKYRACGICNGEKPHVHRVTIILNPDDPGTTQDFTDWAEAKAWGMSFCISAPYRLTFETL